MMELQSLYTPCLPEQQAQELEQICVKTPSKGPQMMGAPLSLINAQIWLSVVPAGRLPSSSPVS